MGDIPVDARRVVDELRAARRAAGASSDAASAAPTSWLPSESFESTLNQAIQPPVHLNGHLNWMHQNWDLRAFLAPPPGGGAKGFVKRAAHRLVMVVLGRYLDRLQDYLGVNTRAIDTVARRMDDQLASQLRMLGAIRSDLIDLARYVDRRLDG